MAVAAPVRDPLLDIIPVGETRQPDDMGPGRRIEVGQEGGYAVGVGGSVIAGVADDCGGSPRQWRPVRKRWRFRPVGARGDARQTDRGGKIGAFLALEDRDDGARQWPSVASFYRHYGLAELLERPKFAR